MSDRRRTATGGSEAADAGSPAAGQLELTVAWLLRTGTMIGVALLVVGVLLMLARGISPLDAVESSSLDRVPEQLRALRPEGFVGLALVVVLATPAVRVGAALLGFRGRGEREMAAVAAGILLLIGVGVIVGLAGR